MNNEYYVYEHRRGDNGELFYVGQGRGLRSHDFHSGRTVEWREIAFRHGVRVQIAKVGLDKVGALIEECKHIDRVLTAGATLVNKAGIVRCRAVRQFGSEFQGEIYYAWRGVFGPYRQLKTVEQMVQEQQSNRQELEDLLDGKINVTSDGWISDEPRSKQR